MVEWWWCWSGGVVVVFAGCLTVQLLMYLNFCLLPCLFCLFVLSVCFVCLFVLFCFVCCRYANAAKNIQNTAIVNRSPHEIAMLRKTLQLNAMTFEYVSCWVWLILESGCLLKVVVC
jgi:uncharacterized membrane protein